MPLSHGQLEGSDGSVLFYTVKASISIYRTKYHAPRASKNDAFIISETPWTMAAEKAPRRDTFKYCSKNARRSL